VWKGIWREHFSVSVLITLPSESTLSRENGETGIIQSRNIALEIVVFGPQFAETIIMELDSGRDGRTDG
jgi:hypothetical protein